MSELQTLDLSFYDCAGIRSEADVAQVFQLVARLGLVPNVRPWTRTPQPDPVRVEEIPAFLPRTHHTSPLAERKIQAGRRLGRLEPVENWRFAVLRPECPEREALMSVGRCGVDWWGLGILVSDHSYGRTDDPGPVVGAWAELLVRIGDALYPRARPVLGLLSAAPIDDYRAVQFPRDVERRRLLVGWRTWYGPAYVAHFGREFLLGLPDRAAPLPDGGVRHELAAGPLALARGDPSVSAHLWPYLQEHGVAPAWPRPPRPGRRAGREAALSALQASVLAQLRPTVELAGGGRRKQLPLAWRRLAGTPRAVALRAVAHALAGELARSPEQRVELVVAELPADLHTLLDNLAREHGGRLSYVVAPELAPPAKARPAER